MRGILGATLATALLVAVLPTSASAATCSDYDNQADAQRAKDTRDADGDGIYCESLPCPCLKPGGGSPPPSPSPTPQPRPKPNARQTIKSRIIDVIDGDTIKVRTLEPTRKPRYTVRLIGIDTPETKKPGTPVECGGKEATDSMFYLAFDSPRDTNGDDLFDTRGGQGRRVRLVTDPSQDRFDRYGR